MMRVITDPDFEAGGLSRKEKPAEDCKLISFEINAKDPEKEDSVSWNLGEKSNSLASSSAFNE